MRGCRRTGEFLTPIKYNRWTEWEQLLDTLSNTGSCSTPLSCRQKARLDYSPCDLRAFENLTLNVPMSFLLLTLTEFLNICIQGRKIPHYMGLHATLACLKTPVENRRAQTALGAGPGFTHLQRQGVMWIFFFLMSPHPRLYFMKQQCCHIHAGWTLWARHDSHTLREGENRQVVDPRLRNTAIHWPQTPASTCVSGNYNIFPSKPCCHMVFVYNSILRPKTRLRKPLCPTHTQKDITSIISINFERN